MAFITEEELGSLRIENMILHVVGDEEFVSQPARNVEHSDFFIERIRATDVEAVFKFEDASQTRAQVERIASRQDEFETGSQALAREFARFHGKTSRKGAFFIFELSTDDESVRIYSLIKYDYQQVIEQQTQDAGNLLRLIVQAFVADKKAIQKSALIRVVEGRAEEAVSATDRMKPAPEIGDYFSAYLHVSRTRDDSQLTAKALDAVRQSLKELKPVLPEQNIPRALRAAKTALNGRQRISSEAVEEAVINAAGNPEDENVVTRIQKCVRRKLKAAKLEGLEFAPDRNILRSPAIRRVRTTEGVMLLYPDSAEQTSVDRRQRDEGGEVITITTSRIEEDDIVRGKPNRLP